MKNRFFAANYTNFRELVMNFVREAFAKFMAEVLGFPLFTVEPTIVIGHKFASYLHDSPLLILIQQTPPQKNAEALFVNIIVESIILLRQDDIHSIQAKTDQVGLASAVDVTDRADDALIRKTLARTVGKNGRRNGRVMRRAE